VKCPQWPLNGNYKTINQSGVFSASGTQLFFIGPPGKPSDKGSLAWVVFNFQFSYNAPLITGAKAVAFVQFNNAEHERSVNGRINFGTNPMDDNQVFPIIGGMNSRGTTTAGTQVRGQDRPLYLPYPHEICLAVTGFPGASAGVGYQIQGLVLEVPLDVNVSEFL